jgi:hypothetical protein
MNLVSLIYIAITAALFVSFFHLNDWLLKAFELHAGANWVFLPAGLRLMCTLVFGIEGAIGLLIGALVLLSDHVAKDPVTILGSALISAGAPYLVYHCALRAGMPATLEQISARLLSVLSLAYALANSALHSFWFVSRGVYPNFMHNWITMFIGDLLGTLIMIYTLKIILALFRRRPVQSI